MPCLLLVARPSVGQCHVVLAQPEDLINATGVGIINLCPKTMETACFHSADQFLSTLTIG
jgi:hypothetical protein